ncbi:MAG: TonB-dependent receptor plug domain-containing protein [Leptospira sp.]|nr:TonB-dependent receptor plug domain-containing protein [Leptospira sp.]
MRRHILNSSFFYLILIYGFLFNFSIQAEDTKSSPIEVKGESSNANKNQNFVKNPTSFQKEINLDGSKNRYISLPDILEREAGIRIRQYGGLGSYSTLSIRGTNPNQTKVYWNGIPLNNSQGGEINLADLPFDNLEKIEIYKSSTPAGFSGSNIGGSINLVSKTNEIKPQTRITLQGGSFKTIKSTISHSNSFEKGSYFFQGLGEKSDQDFSYFNNKGTLLFNTYDDSIDKRRNAQYEKAGFTGNVNLDIHKTRISFLNDFLYRMQGLPGPGNRQTESVRRKFSRFSTAISTNTKEFIFQSITLETKLFHNLTRDDLFDPKSEFTSGIPDSQTDIKQYGYQISPTIYLLDYFQVLRLSINGEQEYFDRLRKRSDHQTESKDPVKRRDYQSFQIQDEFRFFGNRLFLVPQIRFDRYTDRFGKDLNSVRNQIYDPLSDQFKTRRDFTNPSFGIKWIILQENKYDFGVMGNVSKEFRIPSFIELFGERGSIIGNTSLRPEMSRNSDMGFFFKSKLNAEWKWDSEIAYFQKKIYDMILFLPNSQFTLRPENVDSALIKGIETSHTLTWNKGWKFNFQYTYQNAKNTSESNTLNGKYLPLRPKNQISSSLTYFKDWGEIGLEYLFIGANFRDRTNEYYGYLPSRQIYNCFFTYIPYRDIELGREFLMTFEVRNLTNKQVEDLVGYPLPGRSFYLTGSYRF